MNNFKSKLRADFNRAAHAYDSAASIQKIIADETSARAEKILAEKNTKQKILDAGCGTGFVSEALAHEHHVIACDISENMVHETQKKNPSIIGIVADIEHLPFQNMEGIVSSLALQWSQNLESVWSEWNHALAPKGVIIASLFTENSLAELKELNAKYKNPLALETLPSQQEIRRSLENLEMNSSLEMKQYNETYADLFSLLKNLKAIGARAKTKTPHPIAKSVLKKMNEEAGEINVTWEVAFVVIKNAPSAKK